MEIQALVKINDEEKQTWSIHQSPLHVLPQHSITDPDNIMPIQTCIEHPFPEEFQENMKKGNRKTENKNSTPRSSSITCKNQVVSNELAGDQKILIALLLGRKGLSKWS